MPKSNYIEKFTGKQAKTASDFCVVKAGRKPEKDRVDTKGRKVFRSWQVRAWDALKDERLSILVSGTGSGKSLVQRGLATLECQKGEKILIAVPERTIGDSFKQDNDNVVLPNGKPLVWELGANDLCNGGTLESKIERLKKFLQGKPRREASNRTMVCTHQALALAHSKLPCRKWKKVNLYIDEAHHSKALGGDETDEYTSNRLGALVKDFLENCTTKMLLTSACMLRGDGATIVPPELVDQFAIYEHPIDEYLDSLVNLKKFSFTLSLEKTYESGFKRVVREKPGKKTLVYLPPVSQNGVEAKFSTLEALKGVLGSNVGSEGPFETYRKRVNGESFTLRALDLVDDEGRSSRVKAFFEDRDAVDYIFVQNLAREGFDWPAAEYAVVFQPRVSLPMTIQMIGRLLRDYDGKKAVRFHIMALEEQVLASAEDFENYIRTIMTISALGWYYGANVTGQRLQKRREKIAEGIVKGGGKALFTVDPDKDNGTDSLVKGAYELIQEVEELSDEELGELDQSFRKTVRANVNQAFRAVLKEMKGDGVLTPEEHKDPVSGTVREFQINNRTAQHYKELRERYLQLAEVTPEWFQQCVFLSRCKYFQEKGQYVDPRTFPGAAKLFGGRKALDEACTLEGL